MAYCSQCGAELTEGANNCSSCGAVIGAPAAPVVFKEEWDHTDEFEAKDIADNKVYALIAYLLDFVGVIIALLASGDSPYLKFHVREAAKLILVEYVVAIIGCVFCWTCIVPVAAIVIMLMLCVIHIIAFVQVCKGEAKEPWLIRSIKFLK